MYAAAAKERMLAGKKDPVANSRQGSQRERRSDEQAAKAVEASDRSVLFPVWDMPLTSTDEN